MTDPKKTAAIRELDGELTAGETTLLAALIALVVILAGVFGWLVFEILRWEAGA